MSPALAADADVERIDLGEGAWVDVVRGWIEGADEVYEQLHEQTPWAQSRIFRYDHWVDEPRLGSMWKVGQPAPHPVLLDAHRWLQHRYNVRFDGFAMALYRDGRDGQAFHRDRSMRWLEDTVIAVLTLGGQRPWLLRPRSNRYDHAADLKGATHDFSPASGDLIVMGGTCQVGWEHSVAQRRDRHFEPRVSLQWRYTSKRGRPEKGANYNAPRFYGRS